MALTGLFLIMFLTVHLAGNLQLLADDQGESFNIYSHFMAHNSFIQLVSKGNFFFILLHVVMALTLARKNKIARPIGYKVNSGSSNSTWASRSMTLLGILTLIFLLVHLRGFWYEFKFGSVPGISYDGVEMHNSYLVVQEAYTNIFYVGFYVAAMIALGFHLLHGFSSAFQTLGLNHSKYTPVIKWAGRLYAVIVSFLFAIIPIVLYVKSLA
jgi:succinate dehydrogenase / fumarate reductase cytochrome b subunit